MDIGMLHSHVSVVFVFLILFLVKAIFLWTRNYKVLDAIRAKTKIVDMILGTLILVTGVYLLFLLGFRTYLVVKTILVIGAIPIGIIALKRKKKILAMISLLIYIYAYGISETNSLTFDPTVQQAENKSNEEIGMLVYQQKCIDCHGPDGNKGLFKAKPLGHSGLTFEEKYELIKNGKANMPAYGDILTEEQLKAVTEYVEQFK